MAGLGRAWQPSLVGDWHGWCGWAWRAMAWHGEVTLMADYVWTHGAHIRADANAIGTRLEELQREKGGRLTARIYVEDARDETSPLHDSLEWDDVRAAELHREHQARHVLASIRIVKQRDEEGTPIQTIRAFVNLTEQVGEDTQRGYIPIARVLSDHELLQQAIAQAARELRAFEERYASFEAIQTVARTARVSLEAIMESQSVSASPM